jgi:hypothetical protein
MLLYTTVLFIAREPLRKACLDKDSGGKNWRQTNNLVWLR